MQKEFDKINAKLDRIDEKLDKNSLRINKNETNIGWIKMSILGLYAWVANKFFGGM